MRCHACLLIKWLKAGDTYKHSERERESAKLCSIIGSTTKNTALRQWREC